MFPIYLTGAIAEAVCAIVSFVILWALLTEKRDEGGIDAFLMLTAECSFAMTVSDCAFNFCVYFNTSSTVLYIISFLTYLFTGITINVFAAYCLSYLKEYAQVKKARELVINVTAIVLSLSLVWWLLITIYGGNIRFAGNGTVTYLDMHWSVVIFIALAVLTLVGYIWSNAKAIGISNSIELSLTCILPGTFMFFDEKLGNAPAYVCFTICLLVIYAKVHVESNVVSAQNKKLLAEREKELTDTKTRIMVSQMQPHFMYNVLNSIYYLCEKDYEEAQEAISTFADYLRMNMDSMGKNELVTFSEELKHTRTYLKLEKMRFGDRLNVEYDISCVNFKLPCLTLQPMVENAVKHGICKKQDGGTVTICTRETEEGYTVSIIDDGVGYDVTNVVKHDNRSHMGRESVTKRINVLCSGEVVFDSKIGEGSTTTIKIPKNVAHSEEN